MQCKLYPSIPYLDIAPLIRRQIQHVNEKYIESLTHGTYYPGIKVSRQTLATFGRGTVSMFRTLSLPLICKPANPPILPIRLLAFDRTLRGASLLSRWRTFLA
jgi:hypothetical protein